MMSRNCVHLSLVYRCCLEATARGHKFQGPLESLERARDTGIPKLGEADRLLAVLFHHEPGGETNRFCDKWLGLFVAALALQPAIPSDIRSQSVRGGSFKFMANPSSPSASSCHRVRRSAPGPTASGRITHLTAKGT